MFAQKIIVFFIACLLSFANPAMGAPAYPNPIDYNLPDGTTITIMLMGDEKVKWAETLDGYSILVNQDGFFEYAILDAEGNMVMSGIKVSAQGKKTLKELNFLEKVPKGLRFSPEQISVRRQIWEIKEDMATKSFPTTGNRRAICILIGFTDQAFSRTQAEFAALFNQIGYNVNGATGSFKDFYLENSYGQLNLTVDVAGPFTASQNMAYYGANNAQGDDVRPRELVLEAINLADPGVDFSQYTNGGTEVRGLYIIYAGFGEEAGGGANAIWAHAWSLASQVTRDGVTLWRYACSAELRGNSGTNISSIGVIAHEFGHTLGAPDFYDTNYSTGGSFGGTGNWDLMASGSWNNGGATPAHHNGFTKTVVFGWAPLPVLTSPSTITLYNSVQNNNSFYRYDTTTPNEYFLLEKRQQVGFDSNIPGNGMIIYHIHSGVFSVGNSINATHPQRMYPVAQNASIDPTSTPSSYGTINGASCAWTGIEGTKTEFSDSTLPSSRSWAGANSNRPITNILRNSSSQTVTFDFMGGSSCTLPANQATSFSASLIGENQMTINWTRGNGNAVLVLARPNSAINANPINGTSYNANSTFSLGDQVGAGNYAVYNGTGNSVVINGLLKGTTYHFAIFEYNNVGFCYLVPGLMGSATTTGSAPCTYCTPTAASDDSTGITRVVFNTIDNTSASTPAYTDFTSLSTTVHTSQSYALSVRVNTGGNYTVQTRAWIDWNQNCVFETGEVYDLGTATNQTNGLTSNSPLSITVPANVLSGQSTMRVRTRYGSAPTPCDSNDWSEAEDYTMIVVGLDMQYTSSTTTQVTGGMLLNSTNQAVIGIEVVTSGTQNPISLTSLTVNANGTTNVSEIENAKIFYTGTSSTFAATNQFGSTVATPTTSNFAITGNQALADGTNYFWLTFDIKPNATLNNFVDAECHQVVVGGSPYTPTVTAPTGNRQIKGALNGNYLVGVSKFNQVSGHNIYFEKVVEKVWREVSIEIEPTPNKEGLTESLETKSREQPEEVATIQLETESKVATTETKLVEVEQISWRPMENGKPYTGPMFVKGHEKNPTITGIYPTITAAIADLNAIGVSGPVKFLLADPTYSTGETFPLTVNIASPNLPTATNTVTLRPNTGVAASITGSVASGALINVRNSYFTIDGSNVENSTGRNLTISNTNTTGPQVVAILSTGTTPIVGSGLRNSTVINGASSSSAVIVRGADGNAGYFNNITISNNSIQRAFIGIFCNAAVASGNGSGLLINANSLDTPGANSIRLVGVYVQGVDGATVSNNTISNISNTNAEAIRGIWFATGTINGLILGNTISKLTKTVTSADAAITGINLTSGASTNNLTVSGNTISNLTNTGTLTNYAGILNFSPNVTISGNTVQNITQNTNANSFWGIVSSGATNVQISNNQVSAITTATTGIPNGINIQGASTNVQVLNNSISNIKNTHTDGYSSVGLALSSTSTAANVLVANNLIYDITGYGWNSTTTDNGYGIRITSGGGYNIYHNTVHLATNQTLSTGIPACLMVASGLGANSLDIRNNIFSMAATVGTNRCAVISATANTVFSNINHNVYHYSGANLGHIGGSYRTTIEAWRTGTGQDAQSIAANPSFVSNTNLMPTNQAVNFGTPLTSVNTDFAATPRNPVLPTIGAYEMAPGELVWTGATNNNWHTTTNWNLARVPMVRDNATIPAGLTIYPTLSAAGNCRNLFLGSSSTSTATLLDNGHLTVHGTTTVQRHIPRNGWHFLSAPVSGMNIIGSDFVPNHNPLPSTLDLYYWNETVAQLGGLWYPWVNVRGFGGVPNAANFQLFVAGRGYLASYAIGYTPANPFNFAGLLQTGTVGVTVNHSSASPAIAGWNLMGNPYPSAINWAMADKTLFSDNFAYIYDPTLGGGGGGYFPESGLIAPHQGFFVKKATAGSAGFNFTNSIRAHGGTWRKEDAIPHRVRLKLTRIDNGFFDETTLRLREGSLFERDRQDALKLFSFNAQMPQIFTQTADAVQVAISSIPEIPDDLEILLGVLSPVSGQYKIELAETSGTLTGTTVWLHNLKDGSIVNLSASPAQDVFIAIGTHDSHFKLTFAQPTIIGEVEKEVASIYTWNNNLYLNFTSDSNRRQLRMIDTSGRQVIVRELGQGLNHIVSLDLKPGVYVVHVSSPSGIVNKRVLVR